MLQSGPSERRSRERLTCLIWRVFICVSCQKWGVAWPATGQMAFGSWMAEIIGSIQTKTIICVCVPPASKEQTKFVYSVLKWLRAKILNDNWRYRVAKTRPKLVWNLNWSPERRYISSGVAKIHFWQQTSAVHSEWWSTSTASAPYNDFQSTKNVAIVVENRVRTSKYQFNGNCCFKALNLTASHLGISSGPLIGFSAATHFWVAKIGGNQVGKVLRPAGRYWINKTKDFS